MRRYVGLFLVLGYLGLGFVAALTVPEPPPGTRGGVLCALSGLTLYVLFEFFRGKPPRSSPRG